MSLSNGGARELGLEISFSGNGIDEIATIENIDGDLAPALKVGDVVMRIDPRYFRPAEVETLLGDPSKAMNIIFTKVCTCLNFRALIP